MLQTAAARAGYDLELGGQPVAGTRWVGQASEVVQEKFCWLASGLRESESKESKESKKSKESKEEQ